MAVIAEREMITPQEQLRRSALFMANKQLDPNREALRSGFDDAAVDRITEAAARAILRRSDLAEADSSIPTLFDLAVEPFVSPRPLPASLTNWHTALKRLDALPESIPALPEDIGRILDEPCPIRREERKPDGTSYKVSDTHSLYLIPAGTLNELEALVSAYGQTLNANENPLRFRYFWDAARQEHADVRFNEHQWVLISNDVLPGSRNKPYQRQAQLVADLSARARVNYEIPSVRDAFGAIALHNVATRDSLFPIGNEQNNYRSTYTHVWNTTHGYRLAVGGSAPSGVHVYYLHYGYGNEMLGVAALRKF